MQTLTRPGHRSPAAIAEARDASRAPAPRGSSAVLVDAHVHFYPCYDRDLFLDSALAHFRRGARELGLPESTPGCLLLSEGRRERWFERMADEALGFPRGAWGFEPGPEPEVLVARKRAVPTDRVFLLAGRQIVSREGVEVLALATGDLLGDGLPLFDTLGWADERGAIAVLPWGFGKWALGRGRLVRQALGRFGGDRVFLGDSAARPEIGVKPRLFAEAEERRVHILPGTDPLPFPSHARRAGSYGFAARGAFDEAMPARSVRQLVRGQLRQPRAYGRRAGLLSFLYTQARMQALKGAPGTRP